MAYDDLVYLANCVLFSVNDPKSGLVELLKPKLKILDILLCEIVDAF